MYQVSAKYLLSGFFLMALTCILQGGEIHDAIKAGDIKKLEKLLQTSTLKQVSETDKEGASPLHWAAGYASPDVARMLIAKGANLNAVTDRGSTPLHWAANRNASEVAKILIASGADIEARSNKGYTPLHWAAIGNAPDVARQLLAKGAKINAVVDDGDTPLHWAIRKDALATIEVLASHGADLNAKAKDGRTPLQLIKTNEARKIIEDAIAGESENSPTITRDNSSGPHISPTSNLQLTMPRTYNVADEIKTKPVKTDVPVIAKRWALVIGISKYRDSKVPKLQYASTDASSFHQWLVSTNGGGYDPSCVKLLCDEQATGANIRDALFTWMKQPIEEDFVTIYYAGHGSPESPDNQENLFLLPYDVDYSKIGSTGFPMWDIETSLKRFIKAKRVIIIADSCHAAGVGQQFDIARRAGRGLKVNPIAQGFSGLSSVGESICVLSAADTSQFSQEGDKWGGGHGVFTHFLLEGLKGKADGNSDGRVTVGELAPYVSEQVRRATGSAQCPRMAGSFDPALSIGK